VKGVRGHNVVQVLVDFADKGLSERPDFYIVDESFWRRYLEALRNKLTEIREEDTTIIPVWSDGYEGVALRPENVKEYKERWDILEEKLQ